MRTLGFVLLAAALPGQAPPAAPLFGMGVEAPDGARRGPAPPVLLCVTAHPDDEDSAFLAWCRLELGFRCVLLTLTRGEGGQNEIGPELDEALAVLRMGEAESARAYDGAEQRFGLVKDFGFSISDLETSRRWDAPRLLRELVAEIRALRPAVLLVMPLEAESGSRHHQVSARLAVEAAERAGLEGDPGLGAPYAIPLVLEQVWGDPGGDPGVWSFDQRGRVPGRLASYAEWGRMARSAHRSQGMPDRSGPAATDRPSRWRPLLVRDDPRIQGLLDARVSAPVLQGRPERAALLPDHERIRLVVEADRAAFRRGERIVVEARVLVPPGREARVRAVEVLMDAGQGRVLRTPLLPRDPEKDPGLLAATVEVPLDALATPGVAFEPEPGFDRYLSAPLRIPKGGCLEARALLDLPDGELELRAEVTAWSRGPGASLSSAVAILALEEGRGEGLLRPIRHPHVLGRWYRPEAASKPVATAWDPGALRGLEVGWIPGPGADGAGSALRELGVRIRPVGEAELQSGSFEDLAVLVVGTRAGRSVPALQREARRLRAWMESGGRLVVLGQRPGDLGLPGREPLLPYGGAISARRITDESGLFVVLEPAHPRLLRPHRLDARDLTGFRQDLALHLLDTGGAPYQDLLSGADGLARLPEPQRGILVEAAVGLGSFAYCAIPLFREVPRGHPGATRLLLNLLQPGPP
jgi:LmbE family N-acetylglucosaminyl deacetylase